MWLFFLQFSGTVGRFLRTWKTQTDRLKTTWDVQCWIVLWTFCMFGMTCTFRCTFPTFAPKKMTSNFVLHVRQQQILYSIIKPVLICDFHSIWLPFPKESSHICAEQETRPGEPCERSRVSQTNQPTNLWHSSRAAGNDTFAQFFF